MDLPPELTGSLTDIFRTEDSVTSFLEELDFSERVDATRDNGTLPASTLDDRLKIIVASATARIRKLKAHERTWDRVAGVLEQDPALEPVSDPIFNADELPMEGFTSFNSPLDSKIGNSTIEEIQRWLTSLISDEARAIESIINVENLSNIFSRTIPNGQQGSKDVLNIAVLDYPDISTPYFRLYRIKLAACAFTSDNISEKVRHYRSSITGECECLCFKPRDAIIDKLTSEAKKNASQAAEAESPKE